MAPTRVLILTALAMVAFAGNSLLCRVALRETSIDAATFTGVRVASGALMLWLIVRVRRGSLAGSWASAFWLFVYAAGFSFAYVSLTAGTGALLLFGAVQATMIGHAIHGGDRMGALPMVGLAIAFAGLAALLAPGVSAPPLAGAALMLFAGFSWGMYSLRGRGAGDATSITAGNFMRALPMALALAVGMLPWASIDLRGAMLAIGSGAIASGLGYAIWYTALRGLRPTSAASVQLSVPAIAAIGGVILLGEPVTARLVIASVAILGGVALALRR